MSKRKTNDKTEINVTKKTCSLKFKPEWLKDQLGLLRKRPLSLMSPHQKSKRQKRDQEFTHLIVLDFESTCWETDRTSPPEIIEFPAVLLNTQTGQIESEFHYFLQPSERPVLSEFCQKLTGITQEQVDNGIPLSLCLRKFTAWLGKLHVDKNVVCSGDKSIQITRSHIKTSQAAPRIAALVTWSDWDLGVCLLYETKRKQISQPRALTQWIDLRATYKAFYGRKPAGLNGALNELGIMFDGRQHSGLDDARNTARLAWQMIQDGCLMSVTKSVRTSFTGKIEKQSMPPSGPSYASLQPACARGNHVATHSSAGGNHVTTHSSARGNHVTTHSSARGNHVTTHSSARGNHVTTHSSARSNHVKTYSSARTPFLIAHDDEQSIMMGCIEVVTHASADPHAFMLHQDTSMRTQTRKGLIERNSNLIPSTDTSTWKQYKTPRHQADTKVCEKHYKTPRHQADTKVCEKQYKTPRHQADTKVCEKHYKTPRHQADTKVCEKHYKTPRHQADTKVCEKHYKTPRHQADTKVCEKHYKTPRHQADTKVCEKHYKTSRHQADTKVCKPSMRSSTISGHMVATNTKCMVGNHFSSKILVLKQSCTGVQQHTCDYKLLDCPSSCTHPGISQPVRLVQSGACSPQVAPVQKVPSAGRQATDTRPDEWALTTRCMCGDLPAARRTLDTTDTRADEWALTTRCMWRTLDTTVCSKQPPVAAASSPSSESSIPKQFFVTDLQTASNSPPKVSHCSPRTASASAPKVSHCSPMTASDSPLKVSHCSPRTVYDSAPKVSHCSPRTVSDSPLKVSHCSPRTASDSPPKVSHCSPRTASDSPPKDSYCSPRTASDSLPKVSHCSPRTASDSPLKVSHCSPRTAPARFSNHPLSLNTSATHFSNLRTATSQIPTTILNTSTTNLKTSATTLKTSFTTLKTPTLTLKTPSSMSKTCSPLKTQSSTLKTQLTTMNTSNTLQTPASLKMSSVGTPNTSFKTTNTSLLALNHSFKTPMGATPTARVNVTPPLCSCGRRSKCRVVHKQGSNTGRCFFSCSLSSNANSGCRFFQWASPDTSAQTDTCRSLGIKN